LRTVIRNEIERIEPFDAVESSHRKDALAWIDSGVELCRRERPATPPKHLVSYVVVVDTWEILLVDHKNARLWLPPGGHVEPDEHPRFTVERELKEELGLTPSHPIGPPLFVTCTETVGQTAGHIDVSLWYLVRAEAKEVDIDGSEFESARWFPFGEVPHARSDPHLLRFLRKYRS
jgi:ADP-ribose pyrophosphatase YjhB (NUDIX family)